MLSRVARLSPRVLAFCLATAVASAPTPKPQPLPPAVPAKPGVPRPPPPPAAPAPGTPPHPPRPVVPTAPGPRPSGAGAPPPVPAPGARPPAVGTEPEVAPDAPVGPPPEPPRSPIRNEILTTLPQWRVLQKATERHARRFQDLVLQPEATLEKAFRRLGDPAVAQQVAEASAAGGPPPPPLAALAEIRVTPLFARIRARLKGELAQEALSHAEVAPLLGLHPYQLWCLAGATSRGHELADLQMLLGLRSLFQSPGTRRFGAALEQVAAARDERSMLEAWVLLLAAEADRALASRAYEAFVAGLKERVRGGSTTGGDRILELFFQSLLDVAQGLDAADAPVTARIAWFLAVGIDMELLLAGHARRLEPDPGLSGDQKPDPLPADPGDRLRTVAQLDPLLGGYRLRPARPPVASRPASTALPDEEHVVRLRRFLARLQPVRRLLARALERIGQMPSAAPGQRSRLVADVAQAAFGRDPDGGDAQSLIGILTDPVFDAERRALIGCGEAAPEQVAEAYAQVFGDPRAQPPRSGELDQMLFEVRTTVLPFLAEHAGTGRAVPAREELAGLYRRRDLLTARLDVLAAERAGLGPGGSPASRERLATEEAALGRELAELEAELAPADPEAWLERFRHASRRLRDGVQTPEGRVAVREARLLLGMAYPGPELARRRAAEADAALARGVDLRERSLSPAAWSSLASWSERLWRLARGGEPGLPPGAGPEDGLPTLGLPALPALPAVAAQAAPEDLRTESELARRLAAWVRANGPNPWGFPSYATAAEIEAMIDAAITRRAAPGSARPGGGPGAEETEAERYRFWLEVRDPGMRREVEAALEARLAEARERLRADREKEKEAGAATRRARGAGS